MIVLGSTPDLWYPNLYKMHKEMHIDRVGNSINIYHAFSGHVGDVELTHEVVEVAVLVGVLLGVRRDLLHVVIYA